MSKTATHLKFSSLMVLEKTFKDFFKYVMHNIFIIQSRTQCLYIFFCIISVRQTIQYMAVPFPSRNCIAPPRITRVLVFHQLWVNLPVFHPLIQCITKEKSSIFSYLTRQKWSLFRNDNS
jgi:hypothetical protein